MSYTTNLTVRRLSELDTIISTVDTFNGNFLEKKKKHIQYIVNHFNTGINSIDNTDDISDIRYSMFCDGGWRYRFNLKNQAYTLDYNPFQNTYIGKILSW